jgi:peptidoglycan/LPS O-acetylase OafA/YrhL
LLSYLPVFYVGIEIYRAEADGWSTPALVRLSAVTLIVGASMMLFTQYTSEEYALYVIGQAALFVWALRTGWQSVWLSFFGRISYSIYLYHGVLGYELFRHFEGGPVPMWLLVLIACVISFIVAYLSFRLIEEPGVRFGKRIERRWWPREVLLAQ